MGGKEINIDVQLLRIALVDLTEGVRASYLWSYNEELEALVDIPSKQREKELEKLAKKIIKECKGR